MTKENTSNIYNTISLLGAICLFFSTLEYLIPKPIPFIRIGLANLPIILCIKYLKFKDILILTLLKVLGAGIINGTLLSYVFLFSLAGSYSSVLVMYIFSKISDKYISYIGISIAGSFVSNVFQIFLSIYFIFGSSSLIIAPPFLIIGCISGFAIGVFANKFDKNSKWFNEYIKNIYTR